MDQPVYGCVCDDGIVKDLAPFRQGLIGDDNHRSLLVPCGDKLEKQAGDVPVDPEIPYLIDDEKLVFVQVPYRIFLAAIKLANRFAVPLF